MIKFNFQVKIKLLKKKEQYLIKDMRLHLLLEVGHLAMCIEVEI